MPPPDVVQDFFRRIDNLLDELADERAEYQERAREIRAAIQRVMLDAEDAGIPKREMKAVLKARALEDKLAGVRKQLEPGEVETFDQIRAALGELSDTPLGRAALDKAGDRPAA
jgi:hypothetical protein